MTHDAGGWRDVLENYAVPSLSQSTGASEEVIFSLVRYETEYLMSLIYIGVAGVLDNSKERQVPTDGPGESLICLGTNKGDSSQGSDTKRICFLY